MVSQRHTHNTLVFYDLQYPQLCVDTTLHRLVPDQFSIVDATELAEQLGNGCSLLVSFHGAYFPKAAWPAVLSFLERGGNLAIFGGMPFTRPITADGYIEPEQDTYTRQIHLGPFFQLGPLPTPLSFVADQEAVLLKDCSPHSTAEETGTFWSYNPMLTQVSDHPEDMGSAGPFDTVLQPLVYALGTDDAGKQQRVATPVSLLDQRSGRFKGGRWLLSPWLPAAEEGWLRYTRAIQRLILLAAQGATAFDVRPALGCYQPGEVPTLLATARASVELRARVSVYQPDCAEPLRSFELFFPSSPIQQVQSYVLPSLSQPGLYHIKVEYQLADDLALALNSGFWIWDEALVASTRGQRLTAKRDYFYQEDKLFFVYGTTYMDSRVQRKFLHLPNPARWERDFAEMQAAGINLIRTGLWTAWREFVPLAGVVNEAFLRALDAFVLTACKHRMQLVFTFFSFFPPLFEGENPWLDPRSVEAQQDFVALLASRYAQVDLLSWDLINEPSFGDPQRIFAQRPLPNYDRFEVRAFQDWLQKRLTLSELQLRWRQTPVDIPTWESVRPPLEKEYNTSLMNTSALAMFQVADYTRFSQEMFNAWAARMVEAIRAGGGRTLVGVGQDESASRISPQFYAQAVDYTTTHPWWNVDDLLWDMLLDKTPDKPNLIQETGVMQVRDIDGLPWRNQQDSAFLLERKLLTGLIARGAGVIQWLWHTNSYMTSENENSIGLVRADGSAKPELDVMEEFGRLVQALDGRLLEPASPPDIWLVIPYTQWFVRPDLARFGTQQAVRVLGYDLGILPQLVNESLLHTLAEARPQPRAIIVPALQLLDQDAWRYLLQYAHGGGTLLVNGVITRDTHSLPFDPGLDGLSAECAPVPVSRYEELVDVNRQSHQITFDGEKVNYVRKAHNCVYRLSHGTGTLLWCGLPLELASNPSATRALYASALGLEHAVPTPAQSSPLLISRKALRDGTLILVVSESNRPQKVSLDEGVEVIIESNRAGAVLLNLDGTAQTLGGLRIH